MKIRKLSTGIQMLLLAGALAAGVVTSAGMGFIRIGFFEILRILLGSVTGNDAWFSELDRLFPVVIMDVRLPRILTAAFVGGGLSMAGAVFQGILLNPLADPYTLGVSAGAAFGASLAILVNITVMGTWSIPLCAFLGAMATLAAVVFLSEGSGGLSSNNLILSGIIVAAILSAGISFLKYIADEQVAVIIFWLMGSFAAKTWNDVWMAAGSLMIGFLIFLFYSRDLNVVAMGDRTAVSLGVDTQRVRLILLLSASLVSAVAVSVSGIIGFVGLLVPHMMRAFTGPDNRKLIPVCGLAGAVLLLGADTVTRAVLPREIPIGILTALIGGPFFCYVFRRRRKTGAAS
ncbi:MAG: iron ABC transporter permease [Deltaproteobacteria bacterium]|nr:iron ABC transporter permease [Deltaproteobacteria bacterium]MBW2042714.1 iron ABC transporter permease [Deltaproteobacteria bacterium]MBW2133212.1 iron ABC transporter permease [Deltaproteobacteria bacterium]